MTVYCAEPLCLKTGSCTGPRFVPHLVQYVHIEDDGTPGAPRKVSLNEQLAASRFAAKMAEEETGVPDSRTDAEVLDHVQWVRKALAAALGY